MSYLKIFTIVLFFFVFFHLTNVANAALFINEFSSDSDPDWIEIYNSGDEAVDLSLYKIRDDSATNKLDLSETIGPKSFKAFDWSNKLNKPGDLIKLLLISNEENIIDEIGYGDKGSVPVPGSGQSSGRKTDGADEWVIFSSSSKELTNNTSVIIPSPTLTLTPTPSPTKVPIPTKTPTPIKVTLTTTSNNSPTPAKLAVTSTRIPLEDVVDLMTASSQASSEDILGESTLSAETNSSEEKSGEKARVLSSNNNNIGKLLIGISFVFFTACGIVLGAKKFKRKEILDDK